ncbi:hypothetical protein CAEBREN_13338 [Caenorhabditis brenneri]|uniref:Uncharacterized protein n=1 Tax=Caenorhabditis brenneri TaxID=135651 RepID=G0N532_CAEBE|nr:hypothetical protein CAEBREN_13338 [Caenorhabditis brenneri]
MSFRNNNEDSSRRYPDYFINICNISNEDLIQQSYSLSRPSCLFVYGESYKDLLASLCHFTISNKPIVILCRVDIVSEDTFDTRFFHNKLFLMHESANVIILSEDCPGDENLSETRRVIYDYLRYQ